MRQSWLYQLARQQDWKTFLEVYTGNQPVTLQCYKLQAQIKTGQKQGLADDALKLWLIGKSQVKNCDPVFKYLEDNKDKIEEALMGSNLVFVCTGLGRGTGTGAAPIVAVEGPDALRDRMVQVALEAALGVHLVDDLKCQIRVHRGGAEPEQHGGARDRGDKEEYGNCTDHNCSPSTGEDPKTEPDSGEHHHRSARRMIKATTSKPMNSRVRPAVSTRMPIVP